jgi:pimeloyl-ACP methyl ester carboxylesterase
MQTPLSVRTVHLPRWRLGAAGLLALGLILLVATPGRAHLIFFKDGYVLHGKLVLESAWIIDPGDKHLHRMSKGYYFVDDGPRRHFFPQTQVRSTDPKFFLTNDTLTNGIRPPILPEYFRQPPVLEVLNPGAFNDRWHRTYLYRGPNGNIQVPQKIRQLSSSNVEVWATLNFKWCSCYLPQELGFAQVHRLLQSHPDLQDLQVLSLAEKAARRFRLYQFLVNAGWLDEADRELDGIAADLPDERSKVDQEREKLRRLQARRAFDAIEKGHRAGRRLWVQEQIRKFDEKNAQDRAVEKVQSIKTAYDVADAQTSEARKLLSDLVYRVPDSDRQLFKAGVKAILFEIDPESVSRLDAFVLQARQAARQAKKGEKPDQKPEELLSLAVTGWLLGSKLAESRVDFARKLWAAREAVLNYLQADSAAERGKALKEYLEQKNAVGADLVAQMLRVLPPPRAEEKLPQGITAQKAGGTNYHLQLPPEYHHSRPYPLLLVLHDTNESARQTLQRWAAKAAEEGYILAAPQWSPGAFGKIPPYGFSAAEHETVLDTLRDLRKRFNVDSDRVFLAGLGEGGTMAFDVGLSHPDLFAAVLPMSGNPRYFIRYYWANAQYLPFYVVGGEYAGDANRNIRSLFEKWIPHHYPVIYVQYKGRGAEWFGAELPNMFDWMSRKKRQIPATRLGRVGTDVKGDEFCTMRATDNRFYWVSTNDISGFNLNQVPGWNSRVLPATLVASINPEVNSVMVHVHGLRQVTVWLARGEKGTALDFDKPVSIWVNNARYLAHQKVKDDLSVLLEDYYRRGDRQKLFTGKLEFKLR